MRKTYKAKKQKNMVNQELLDYIKQQLQQDVK